MSEQNDANTGTPAKKPKHHLKDAALDKLHRIEDSALDAYHTIEDHNTRELQQDVKGFLSRLAEWSALQSRAFKTWYLAQPLYLQIAYGLTLLPVLVVLAFLVLVLIKFGGPLLLATALVIKLTITLIKTLLFLGYIAYKILKTLIMWYYILTRLYFGRKAKTRRFAHAQACKFAVEPATLAADLRFHCAKKYLDIEHAGEGHIRVLFSYLRYALVGHVELFRRLKDNWRHYLTIWQSRTRNELKALLTPLGDSLFSPHKLGAHVTSDRVLVPGDAELIKISAGNNDAKADALTLSFRIRWIDWHFKLRKQLKFLQIRRVPHEDIWTVHAQLQADGKTAVIDTGEISTNSVM